MNNYQLVNDTSIKPNVKPSTTTESTLTWIDHELDASPTVKAPSTHSEIKLLLGSQ